MADTNVHDTDAVESGMHADQADGTVATVQHPPHEGASAIDLFKVDPGLVLWTWITFGILFLVLAKYALKPLLAKAEEREKLLADAVLQAEETRKALARIDEKQREVLAAADEKAQDILRQSREAADENTRRALQEAHDQADRMLEDAKGRIDQERDRALKAIKEEAVDLVISASSRLIEQELDEEGNRTLVEKHLEEL